MTGLFNVFLLNDNTEYPEYDVIECNSTSCRRADKILSMDPKSNGDYKVSKLSFDDIEKPSAGRLPDASPKV